LGVRQTMALAEDEVKGLGQPSRINFWPLAGQ
jgi:hypothetical protein